MLSYKLLQDASAFRLWCKANDMKVEKYDEVAKNLDKYRNHKDWKDIIEESKNFVGVVESISPSPCSMILYNKPIDEEIGIVRTKDGFCCNIDGYNCDKYKYLKNDYLSVKIYRIIRQVCEMANIDIPTIKELTELLDDKTYDIYKNKLTCTINQTDSDFATKLVSDYKVSSVAEVSAFVAAIRPGFASLLDNFIERKPYTTGVEELDDILKDSYHYLMYQESIMKYLIWLGIKESESYDIIKKIAKKKFKEKELKDLKEQLKRGWLNRVGTEEGFEDTWQVVEDAAKYSFNASHSLSYAYDSLYGAYLKSHYPMEYYAVTLNLYSDDIVRTTRLTEELDYFDIKLEEAKFRYSKVEYFPNRETRTIYKGIESIKYLNSQVAEYMYTLKDNKYDTFTDLLIDLQGHINSRQLEILITLDFFIEFGKSKKLVKTAYLFNTYYGKKQFNKDKVLEEVGMFAKKETEKQYREVDTLALCKYLEENTLDTHLPIEDRIKCRVENVGSCSLTTTEYPKNVCIVIDIDTKYTPRIKLYSLHTGKTQDFKISKKMFAVKHFENFSLIEVKKTKEEHRKKRVENGVDNKGKVKYKYIQTEETDLYLENYTILTIN